MRHPFARLCFLSLSLCLLFSFGGPKALAQLYWDTNDNALYSGNAGGIWGTDDFWSTDAHGLSATTSYTSDSSVVFAAGNDGTGTYTVTLASGQSASGIDFQEGHVTIAPATPLVNTPTHNFADVQILTLTGTAPIVNVQNMDATITSRMTAPTLVKNGYGKLTLDYGISGNGGYFNLSAGGSSPIVINAGTLELKGTGGSANQLTSANGITVNSGATFLWNTGPNSIADGTRIIINTGGVMNTKTNDQFGSIEGNGLIVMRNASMNLSHGSVDRTFSGLITGVGSIQTNGGSSVISLTNANTFTGNISGLNTNASTGGLRLGHTRAAQNATINLVNFDVNRTNITFAAGIGTFITGGLQGTSNLVLEDAIGGAITLQTGNIDSSTTYRGTLSGSGGLTKIGMGTLTLTGESITVTRTDGNGNVTATYSAPNSNTYTGDTTILAGAHNPNSGSINETTAGGIRLDFNSTTINSTSTSGNTYTYAVQAATNNIISASSRLVLGGGKLSMLGRNTTTGAAAVSQTFNNTHLLVGRSYVSVAQGTAANDTVLHLGNITREDGSIVEFTLTGGSASLTNGVTTTTANDASGILGGWAIIGNNWAVKNTTGNAIGNVVAASSDIYTSFTSGDISSSTVSNLLINNSETTITTGNGITDVNTIMVRNDVGNGNAAINRTIDIGAGEILRLGETGSIWNQGSLVTTGTPNLTIGSANSVGVITAGGADNTAGEIIIHNSGNGEILIRSSIQDNGDGAVTLIRTGSGNQVVFSGANSHTGGTIITQGRNRFDNINGLGSGPVTVMAGGQLWLNAGTGTYNHTFNLQGTGYGENNVPGAIRFSGGQTLTGQINLTGDTRLGVVNAGNVVTLAGKVTGDYALDLSGYSSGAFNTFVLSNPGNDFTGNLSLGTNFLATPTAFSPDGIVTLRLGASEVIPNGLYKGNLILSAGSGTGATTLDLYGFNETVNSLISYGTHTKVTITNNLSNSTSVLTIGDNNTSTLVTDNINATTFFGGIIRDNGTGIVALTKIGEGTQTLTGASTYSGATNINKGILQAGGENALSANSDYTLANDATVVLALTDSFADYSQTIKSLSGFGTVNLGTIAAADATRLTTGSSADTVYAGTIVGAGGLIKQGSGRFTLTGVNTYVGSTTVTQGNLQVGQSGSGQTGTGLVTVDANGTLSGTGTVRGATTIYGTLKAGDNGGDGIGKLTFSDLTASALSLTTGDSSSTPRAIFTLAGATGNEANPVDGIQNTSLLNGTFGNHDAWEIHGGLVLTSGSTILVEFAPGYNPMWGDVFNLVDWGVTNGGTSAIDPGTFNPNTDLIFQPNDMMIANGWYFERNQFLTDGIVYVVPEPGRLLLLASGLVFVCLGRRRR
jgi:autotransporter-associated beta strand protein